MAMHQIEDEESRILSARMTVAALLETLDFDYGRLERLLGDFGGVALQTPSLLEVSRLLLRLQVTRALERDPSAQHIAGLAQLLGGGVSTRTVRKLASRYASPVRKLRKRGRRS
jgi:hypothetical protein